MNELEQAAYDYADATLSLESADECGMPSEFLAQIRREKDANLKALLVAAMEFHRQIYDGATE
jgi:hypothetical protein